MSSFIENISHFNDKDNFKVIDGIIYIVDAGNSYKSKVRNNMELNHACYEEFSNYSIEDVDKSEDSLVPVYTTMDYTTEEFDEDIYLNQRVKNYNSITFSKPKSHKKHNKRNKPNILKVGNSIKTIELTDLQLKECNPKECDPDVCDLKNYEPATIQYDPDTIRDCFDDDNNCCYCGYCNCCSSDDSYSYYSQDDNDDY
jgi:hypothetical protein